MSLMVSVLTFNMHTLAWFCCSNVHILHVVLFSGIPEG